MTFMAQMCKADGSSTSLIITCDVAIEVCSPVYPVPLHCFRVFVFFLGRSLNFSSRSGRKSNRSSSHDMQCSRLPDTQAAIRTLFRFRICKCQRYLCSGLQSLKFQESCNPSSAIRHERSRLRECMPGQGLHFPRAPDTTIALQYVIGVAHGP